MKIGKYFKSKIILSILAISFSIVFAIVFAIYAYGFGSYFTSSYGLDLSLAVPFFEILAGCFLITSLGLAISSDSRLIGIIYASITAVFLLVWIFNGAIVRLGLFILFTAIGLVIGGILAYLYLKENRGDKVAITAKVILTIWFISIIGIFAVTIYNASLVSAATSVGLSIICGVCLLILIPLYVILMKLTKCVNSSEIFVLGPPSSGKTYFSVALHQYLVLTKKGYSDESIILNNGGRGDSELSLINQEMRIRRGEEPLRRTDQTVLVIHTLHMKKLRFIPITWTLMDYAGEHYSKLTSEDFEEAIEKIATVTNKNDSEIKRNIGSVNFIKDMKNDYSDVIRTDAEFASSLVIATVYSNIMKSDKLLFLVDGEKNINNNARNDLGAVFDNYSRIIENYYSNAKHKKNIKKFALVMTKTDLVCLRNDEIRQYLAQNNMSSLSQINEKSNNANKLEEEIYSELERWNTPLNNIINRIDDAKAPMYFISVSVDRTAICNEKGDVIPAGAKHAALAPWGFSKIIKFSK